MQKYSREALQPEKAKLDNGLGGERTEQEGDGERNHNIIQYTLQGS